MPSSNFPIVKREQRRDEEEIPRYRAHDAGEKHGPPSDAQAEGDGRKQVEHSNRGIAGIGNEKPTRRGERRQDLSDLEVFAYGRRLRRLPFDPDTRFAGGTLGRDKVDVDRAAEPHESIDKAAAANKIKQPGGRDLPTTI